MPHACMLCRPHGAAPLQRRKGRRLICRPSTPPPHVDFLSGTGIDLSPLGCRIPICADLSGGGVHTRDGGATLVCHRMNIAGKGWDSM